MSHAPPGGGGGGGRNRGGGGGTNFGVVAHGTNGSQPSRSLAAQDIIGCKADVMGGDAFLAAHAPFLLPGLLTKLARVQMLAGKPGNNPTFAEEARVAVEGCQQEIEDMAEASGRLPPLTTFLLEKPSHISEVDIYMLGGDFVHGAGTREAVSTRVTWENIDRRGRRGGGGVKKESTLLSLLSTFRIKMLWGSLPLSRTCRPQNGSALPS